MEVKDMRIKRCHICHIGFPGLGELTSEIWLENHTKILHNNKCFECGGIFISEVHLHYHLRHRHIWGHILGGAHINSGPYEEKWPRLQ